LEGTGIYCVILGGYALLVATGIWLLSRPDWLPVVGGWIVLIDGLALSLFLLHRWLARQSR